MDKTRIETDWIKLKVYFNENKNMILIVSVKTGKNKLFSQVTYILWSSHKSVNIITA